MTISYRLEDEDGGPTISLDWDVDKDYFSITVENDGSDGEAPFRTILKGEVERRISENGRDLEIAVVPAEDAIRVMTADSLENERVQRRQEAERNFQAILGEWRDQEGRRWVLSQTNGGSGADLPSTPKPSNAQGAGDIQREIKKRRDLIAQLNADVRFVWRKASGEEVRQTKFKKLSEPWQWVAKTPNDPDEIARLEREIEELSRGQSAVDVPSPPDLPEAAPDQGVFSIDITRYQKDGFVTHFRDSRVGDGKIRGNRTLGRELESAGLPESITRQLIAIGAPEWIELEILQDPETGELQLRGARYRLHVTHSDGKVTRIHTPYAKSLLLTPAKPKIVKIYFSTPDAPYEPTEELAVGRLFRVIVVSTATPGATANP